MLFVLLAASVRSQVLTNMGTDFWIAFPPNSSSSTLKLYISSDVATSGHVSSAFPGVDQDFTVVPGVVTQLSIPTDIKLLPGVESKGIHVTSLLPVAVYGLNKLAACTDAYLALPVPSLGVDYRVMCYKAGLGSGVSVVATQNGTVLTVFNHQTNSTNTVNLDQGQTYYVESTAVGQDLTGSRVQSNFPVSVYGSVKSTMIPTGCAAADHLCEQMWPVNTWGKDFITVPLAGRNNSGDIFRMLAAEDGTDISVNGILVSSLNAGDFFETNLIGYNSVTSTKAIHLAQFAKGITCSGNITGDPFMMLINPREQFLTHYTVGTVSGFAYHWTNLVVPSYALGTVYEDGTLIPTSAFTAVGTTGFYGAQRSITEGSHTYYSSHPFGVWVYGWNPADSYGYPGGVSMSEVAVIAGVSISPPTAAGTLNITSVCFTAHVWDSFNNPAPGILVNFNISGINPVFGNGYTDNAGNAQFCYTQTGTVPGTDNVFAEAAGFTSTTSTVTWSNLPCENPTDGGSIGNAQSGCTGFTATPITSLSLPSGQAGTLEYRWQSSVTGPGSGFTDIGGSNSETWSPGIVLQTTWYRRQARVDCKSDWSGAVVSNVIELTVIPTLTAGISITSGPATVCQGTAVTFNATGVNGGLNPVYQWKVNGDNAGTGTTVFTYVPANGDMVSCVLTSSEPCVAGSPATSNSISITTIPVLPASVSISAAPNPFCAGTLVTATATGSNGGTSPVYQWIVNGSVAGGNQLTYSFNPANNDSIRCIMTSNLSCVSGSPASSARITMQSKPLPVVSLGRCFDSLTTTTAQPVNLAGGIPLGGTYSGPGVDQLTHTFDPLVAGTGIKTITYSYTNSGSCSALATRSITVVAPAAFSCGNPITDIRDHKTYPTVHLGNQCWMAANLDYGLAIASSQVQADNCVNEKYCYGDNAANCADFGGLYQWDELMKFGNTPGRQGICPPSWHVPTEAEWVELCNFYQGFGLAGRPLQDTIITGFRALRGGVFYLNASWNFTGFASLFWTSSSLGPVKAIAHGLNTLNYSVSSYHSSRANSFPLRCLKD